MRQRVADHGVTINAIAGTHVVVLGLDLEAPQREGCLGFAIQREDRTEDERYWLSGMKTFQATDPMLGPGGQVSSREHPFQSFQWCDYSAKPDHEYTYTVVPLYGTPEHLTEGERVSVEIATEALTGTGPSGSIHSVHFNRGAVASQEYARRFQNQAPDEVGEPAYRWLSRGLFEAFVAFVSRADGPRFALYGAVYEFQWPGALQAIKDAHKTGAKVQILYDAIPGDSGPKERNEAAIAALQIKGLCKPRTLGKIMHNKFFVLVEDDRPVAVWTGSTNLTENGIFGHSNCAQAVEDPTVAAAYFAYWEELKGNPTREDETAWVAEHSPAPEDFLAPATTGTAALFSPRKGLEVLEGYAALAASARKGLFMTFAFGMHKSFQQAYERRDGVLRFALMEKEGNGSALAQGKIDIARIRRLPNVVVAIGNNIALNSFDRWLQERRGLSTEVNVRYIHNKYMLVDPLGEAPIVVTGSANFSVASTNSNNENMLIVRNDKRVADIYLGEFMRLYSHYAFREAVKIAQEKGEVFEPQFLAPDASWQKDYFKKGHPRSLRRIYFAG